MALIVCHPIDLDNILASIEDPSAGAVALFVGTVKDHNEKGHVIQIHYEAYEEMAKDMIVDIEKEMKSKWRLEKVAMVHRVGTLMVGEASVAVAVSSEHRKDAFEACRYGIDNIKNRLPIWKKEFLPSGEEWVAGILPAGV